MGRRAFVILGLERRGTQLRITSEIGTSRGARLNRAKMEGAYVNGDYVVEARDAIRALREAADWLEKQTES